MERRKTVPITFSVERMRPKKVLLIVIDALATCVIQPAMEAGRLPNLKKLAQRGQLVPRCISVFPSITPAATCSIATGEYPRTHEILGHFWYDKKQRRVAYYGDDGWVILNKGIGAYFQEFMVDLNMERLKADTLFERIERQGLRSACVNYMWLRGPVPHEVNVPLLLKLIPGLTIADEVPGPSILYSGDFIRTRLESGELPSAPGGLSYRFGFHDDASAAYLQALAKSGMPDFTLAYFPNNDFESHEHGPAQAIAAVETVDEHLGRLFSEAGGVTKWLEEVAVVITGDHGQSDLCEDPSQRAIELGQVLSELPLVDAGDPWDDDEQLMVCTNMRAVQIYCRRWTPTMHRNVIDRLLHDPKVDQVIWDDRHAQRDAEPRARHWLVGCRDRGQLEFWIDDGTEASVEDDFGNRWCWRGDLETVGASRDSAGRIHYTDYPNALERIAGGVNQQGGHVWATARPGHEFKMPRTKVHAAGSHGALNSADSTSPLIAAGLPEGLDLPEQLRLVDVAPLCLSLLGLASEHEMGTGRGAG